MINSKCIGLFLAFSDEELRFLKKWVQSPIANKHKDVIGFFDFLFSRKSYTSKTLQKEKAYAHIFQDAPYNEAVLRHILSYATKTMEECLEYLQFKKDRNVTLPFIRALEQKKLNSQIVDSIDNGLKALLLNPIRDSAFYQQQFQLESMHFNYLSRNSRHEELQGNLQKIIDNLHVYSMAETLRYACASYTHLQIINQSCVSDLLQPTLTIIEQKEDYLQFPPVAIYYFAYKVITEHQESYFTQLLDAVYKFEHCFNKQELRDIFMLCINLCIKKINQGDNFYAQKAYELYLHALSKEYYLVNGELDRFTFKNIVFIGLKKLKDYKGIEEFIHKYQHLLPEDYRENTVQFSNVHLYFYKKEFKKAMNILIQVEFKDVFWNLNAKILLLQIYYETNESAALESLLKSFRVYLTRLKNIGYQREKYEQQLSLFNRMHKLKDKSEVQKKKEVKELFLLAENLPEKEWFKEQLNKTGCT